MEPCRRSLAGRDSLSLSLIRDRAMWVLVSARIVKDRRDQSAPDVVTVFANDLIAALSSLT